MSRLLNIGFGNVVNMDKVVAVVSPDAAPIKRMVQAAKEADYRRGYGGAFRSAARNHRKAFRHDSGK